MANSWPIHVKTCADCPMRDGDRCGVRRWLPYLDERRDGLDVTASLAGAPPPAGCPLANGEMSIPIMLHSEAWRCSTCGAGEMVCAKRVAWERYMCSTISNDEYHRARVEHDEKAVRRG